MMTWTLKITLMATLTLGFGCASLTQTPPDFVELDDASWDYRATSADGVVVTVRHLAHDPEGALEFWARVVKGEMTARGGYELLGQESARTKQGETGTLLRFRNVTQGTTHLYYVALFTDEDTFGPDDLYVIEAGGTEASVKAAEPSIRAAIEGLRVD